MVLSSIIPEIGGGDEGAGNRSEHMIIVVVWNPA